MSTNSCSPSLDLMVWTRSSRDDFDKYANLSNSEGWSWDAIEPYFRKVLSSLFTLLDAL